ncbi:MAG: aminotransferase class V-fold PLP-dependent enzyme [Bacteroidota bacterium]|nr:aminotransferase class V-fold PLP-dependent enzyme [Bacteroidota bacterium]MDP4231984.1 aminotransferase class V-fold PLP-dependent enzyme [Bacteroidota bacterium]MDP4241309.1 aminotransferase class V-fold PLP-dependent enzyme [Bacteroidota bacterium]MDP4287230.1 aminotransferase class V-fold PLP-dependent enzyme [Bacteroidota bacterium]
MDQLAAKYRSHFPILETSSYLISNSLGAMPREVESELKQYTDIWQTEGVEAWHAWFPFVDEVSGLIANLIGADSSNVTLIHNLTIGSALIASCLDFTGKRNEIVYSDLHFPTISYLWQGWRKYGAVPHVIESDGIWTETEKYIEAIDETTKLVALSHVYFRSGGLQNIKPIIEHAHKMGALVMVDSYQAAGVVPIDVKALDCDILATGVLKWLCGGPGAAFMYVRPELQEQFRPAIRGWLGDREPFEFHMPDVTFESGMHRFLTSSIQVPCLHTARPALRMFNEIGIAAIREKSLQLTGRLIVKADEHGFTINSPREAAKRGGALTIDPLGNRKHPKLTTKDICDELIRRRFIVDYRPPLGIRIAPHFYNTMDEIDAVTEEIERILAA